MQNAPAPPWWPCFSTDFANFANNFLKGSHMEQSCEIIPNSDQWFRRRRFCRTYSSPHSAKSPPPPQSGSVFRWIRISRTIFEEGDPRNNSVKLFQNWIDGFRGEDF